MLLPALLLLPVLASSGQEVALGAARRAAEQGEPAAARAHLERALQEAPGSLAPIELALELLGDSATERWRWSLEWARRHAGEEGRLEGELRRRVVALDGLEAWARLRDEAVRELLALSDTHEARARRRPEEHLVARWARRVALDLADPCAHLREHHRAALDPGLACTEDDQEEVLEALERALGSTRADPVRTIAVARVLRGLATQAGFPDLRGPRPPAGKLGKVGERAAKALAEARTALRSGEDEPWTVEELRWLDRTEGEVLTRRHDDFSEPAVALSPQGLYRIETDCGVETLLAAASTVELHHRRLADWYGRDPFEETPGLVRVVPRFAGLESEGTPFHWAGGFQSGNTTVLRFALGNAEDLGRGLVHELTHRFDGALFPGQPAWLTEGKAVWTAAAYESADSPFFVADHAVVGTLEQAWYDGYGSQRELEKLLAGEPDDYRDNYVAGYALYVFLRSWRADGEVDGARIFEGRLEEYMASLARFRGDPVQHFEASFADGLAGRPEGMVEFATLFARYLAGFYWRDPEPWVGWYVDHEFDLGPPPQVRDQPTWSLDRVRSEPWYGQDQAREAGRTLLALGRRKEALGALLWSLAVDGRDRRVEREAAELARGERAAEAAFALDCELAHPAPFPDRRPALDGRLADDLPRTHLFLERTLALAARARADGAPTPALALEAEAERLRAWLGLPPSPPRVAEEGEPELLDPPGRPLDGWSEESLADYDRRRIEGLWYLDERGDLHVGRARASTSSGIEARARQRHAFALAERWVLPGTWRLVTRIQFTTAYASGCVVLGRDRRDRDVRLHFSAGDFLYATGLADSEPTFGEMHWSLRGRFEREGALPGTRPGGRLRFDAPRAAFELELLVDGPLVVASINGEEVGRHVTPDGSPLEGRVGFAMDMGAVRVEAPVVQRLDRTRIAGGLAARLEGLDLERGAPVDFAELVGRPVAGLPPSRNGHLVLWVAAEPTEDPEDWRASTFRAVDRLARRVWRADAVQPVSLVLPEASGDAEWLRTLTAPFERAPLLREHRARGDQDRGRRWLLYVDPAGTVRHVESFAVLAPALSEDLVRWLDATRDLDRPERELPALPTREELRER